MRSTRYTKYMRQPSHRPTNNSIGCASGNLYRAVTSSGRRRSFQSTEIILSTAYKNYEPQRFPPKKLEPTQKIYTRIVNLLKGCLKPILAQLFCKVDLDGTTILARRLLRVIEQLWSTRNTDVIPSKCHSDCKPKSPMYQECFQNRPNHQSRSRNYPEPERQASIRRQNRQIQVVRQELKGHRNCNRYSTRTNGESDLLDQV
jgi:hypothetical protein